MEASQRDACMTHFITESVWVGLTEHIHFEEATQNVSRERESTV